MTAAVTFVGHPFSSIGKGEEIRSAFSAYKALDRSCKVFDVYRYADRSDQDHLKLLHHSEASSLSAGVRVFHINGDEVEQVLATLEKRGIAFEGGRNVIVPAWELPVYPAVWLDALKRFDEVWAISQFVRDGLAAAGMPSVHIGQSVELPSRPFLPRRHFGIRASSFVFLALFDLSSYSTRKNPEAVVEMYSRLRAAHPFADMQLVLKVKNGESDALGWIEENLGAAAPDVVVVDSRLTTHEVHSLIAACDCMVSLHRAEGFGRGAGEAMWLGRLAIATAWSGNLDYMDASYPGSVGSTLVPVEAGQYPHHAGQHWAEPDLDQAVWIADQMLSNADFRRRAITTGKDMVRASVSHRAVGLRMLDRVTALTGKGR